MNRNDLKLVAELRLREAKALLNKKYYDGAYYLTGYAVECALRSCIVKQTKRYDFPDRKIVIDSYTHDLNQLVRVSGLQTALELEMRRDGVFQVNWAIVKDWSEGAGTNATIWFFRPEVLEWRLFIATLLVDQKGPASACTDIQGALRSLAKPSWISMQDISVVSPNDKLVKVIKKAARIPIGADGVRFARTRVDDTYIEDAYVYRVRNGRS